jgi:hypothetical protein
MKLSKSTSHMLVNEIIYEHFNVNTLSAGIMTAKLVFSM